MLHDGVLLGRDAGNDDGGHLPLPRGLVQPGDVLLGANPDCVWGTWSHASIALGGGEVLGFDLMSGIYRSTLAEFGTYRRVRILRPRSPAPQGAAAAARAEGLVGAMFCLSARRADPRRWTCAKAVWWAWRDAGIDLAPEAEWVTPDDLAASPALDLVWEGVR